MILLSMILIDWKRHKQICFCLFIRPKFSLFPISVGLFPIKKPAFLKDLDLCLLIRYCLKSTKFISTCFLNCSRLKEELLKRTKKQNEFDTVRLTYLRYLLKAYRGHSIHPGLHILLNLLAFIKCLKRIAKYLWYLE
jgi:hypothetical protein